MKAEVLWQEKPKRRRQLLKMIQDGTVELAFHEKIVWGGQEIENAVSVSGLVGFKETRTDAKSLMETAPPQPAMERDSR